MYRPLNLASSVFWALVISATLAGGSVAQTEETGREKKPGGIAREDSPLTNGILPSIGIWFRVPETLQLRYPEEFGADDQKLPKYDRFFPIGGQKVVDRGIVLPRPWGIGFIGVSNVQEQLLNNGDVAIGRDFVPPKGTPLTPIPFVAFDNVISDTTSKQLKVDVWILPFLNLYGVLGKVTGKTT
jgi:hypothetical protein